MNENPLRSELDALIDSMACNTISDDGEARLEEIVATDLAARRHYLEKMFLLGQLHCRFRKPSALDADCTLPSFSAGKAKPVAKPPHATERPKVIGWLGKASTNRPLVWSMLAASVLFAAYVTAITWNMWGRADSKHFEIAHDTADGKLVPDKAALTRPTAPIGKVTAIASGIVEVRLNQGATMMVEGPAQWTVIGNNEATLDFGKLIAQVPAKAHGFTLTTPTTTIVDLGTEFAVGTTQAGDTDVHVLKGTIEVSQLDGDTKQLIGQLEAGDSVTVGNGQTPKVIKGEAIPEDLRKLAEFGRRADGKPIAAPTTGLVAYYPFDGDTRDHAGDFSENSGTAADDLKLVEASEFLEGRVGKALRFTGGYAVAPGSRDFQLPPTFTIEAWLSPETLTDGYQRSVMNWGEHGTHYLFCVFRSGMELGISQANGTLVRATGGTLKPWEWQHVAGVADGKQLCVYINGALVTTLPYDGTLRSNEKEGLGVGDNVFGDGRAMRLRGSIDELAIWNIPLGPEQIAAHFINRRDGYGLHAKPMKNRSIETKSTGSTK